MAEHEEAVRERERVEAAMRAEREKAEAANKAQADRLNRLKASSKLEDNVTAMIEEKEGVVISKMFLVKKAGNQYEGEFEGENGNKGFVEVTAEGGVVRDRKVLAKWRWVER